MRNDIRNIGKLLGFLGVLAALQMPSQATIVMVYANGAQPISNDAKYAADSIMKQVKATPSISHQGTLPGNETLRYSIFQGTRMSRAPSIGSGVAAYFLCDSAFKMDGFSIKGGGHAAFAVVGTQGLAKQALDGQNAGPKSYATSLTALSLVGKNLQLSYTLSKPGSVHVEILGVNGRMLGKWSWEEGASGAYTRELNMGNIAGHETVFVRWESGAVHSAQKVLASGSKEK